MCDRCAERRMPPHLAAHYAVVTEARELLCPLDGDPLGQGEAWVVVAGDGSRLRECQAAPDEQVVCQAWAAGRRGEAANTRRAPILAEALGHHEAGRFAEAADACRQLLEDDGKDVFAAALLRQALERLGRFDEAWKLQEWLYHIGPLDIAPTLVDLLALDSPDLPSVGTMRQELLSIFAANALGGGRGPIPPAPLSAVPLAGRASDTAVEAVPGADHGPRPDEHVVLRRPLLVSLSDAGREAIDARVPRDGWAAGDLREFIGLCAEHGPAAFQPSVAAFADRLLGAGLSFRMAAELAVEGAAVLGERPIACFLDLLPAYAESVIMGRAPELAAALAPAAAWLVPAEILAGEYFRSGWPEIPVGDLSAVIESERPDLGPPQGWSRSLPVYVTSCPILAWHDPAGAAGAVGFAHPFLEDACLARYLWQHVFDTEKPDLKLLGAACLSQAAARFVAVQAAASEPARQRLQEWAGLKRQRRSLFKGADIPTFARNVALVTVALTGSARGLDLTDADFSGLDLEGADFRAAILTGATFLRARLRGADFTGASLAGAAFEGADLADARITLA